MKAFFGKEEIKKQYLERVYQHYKADEIIKGQYWEDGKGCAVGCTIHGSDHSAYERELGIPQWLARLEDRIFENLPNERAKQWPAEFLEAVPLGADLQKIFHPMLIFICESAREKTKNELAHTYIDGVLAELKKDKLDLEALRKARAAARPRYAYAYAAYAADAAAAAAYAADTDAVAYAAAYAVADAVAYAYAYAAAREKEFAKFADKLLELIRASANE